MLHFEIEYNSGDITLSIYIARTMGWYENQNVLVDRIFDYK